MLQHKPIGLDILVIDKYFKMYLKRALKPYSLNGAEGLALLTLYKHESDILSYHKEKLGKTQDEIIEELHYDKGVMTRTMQSLENKGYVKRKSNPKDARSYVFEITEESILLKPHLLKILEEWNNILLKDMDNETADILRRQLEKMVENIICSNKI